ncbi:hypothetical protein M885DRAFT_611898 [Pelagophyceae sp. CCMP2097]|nr:hypothetical protein M885DRAFT_611898 [Pelagophyceae sp. CCMP2097]
MELISVPSTATMDASTAASKPSCVCAAQNGKHCTKCKSRHYCSKACQLVDWRRGHKAQCRQLASEFQDHMLDALMPEKKVKEVPAIVEGVSLADGAKAADPAILDVAGLAARATGCSRRARGT